MADTQFNNVVAITTRTHSSWVKFVASAAIRPPTLDAWTSSSWREVLDSIRKQSADSLPIFFLGDGANISCIGEYHRFLDSMKGRPWFGVIGNHDGYYMGNYTWAPDVDGANAVEPDTWSGACNQPAPVAATSAGDAIMDYYGRYETTRRRLGALEKSLLGLPDTYAGMGTMPKTDAIWLYLSDLAHRAGLAADPLDQASWKRDAGGSPDRVYEASGVLQPADGVQWRVTVKAWVTGAPPHVVDSDPRAERYWLDTHSTSWRGFVVQDVALAEKLHVLLVDTSDFDRLPPSTWWQRTKGIFQRCKRMPGECGDIGPEQTAFLVDRAKQITASGGQFFVMGHHDWQSLRARGHTNLKSVFRHAGFITYVSGHTHKATATGSADGAESWEINVASVTDWPMEYAKLSWSPRADQGHQFQLETMPVMSHGAAPTCPLNEDDAPERTAELNYGTVDRYSRRAATQYARLLAKLDTILDDHDRQLLARSCDAPCVAHYRSEAREAATAPKASDRRQHLMNVLAFDQRVLSELATVRAVEAQCAMWASAVEGGGRSTIKQGHRLAPGKHQWTLSHRSVPQ